MIKKTLLYFLKKHYVFLAKLQLGGFKGDPVVNKKCVFNKNVFLGVNCNFNGISITGNGKVTIGDNFHSGCECMIISQNHNIYGKSIPYDNSYICKDIHIGDNVWIGNRVIILPGVTIGEGAVIQAGSVVVNNIPDLAIAGGHPAQVFSYRDTKHYYEKKNQRAFN